MASKIWLNIKEQISLKEAFTANIFGNYRFPYTLRQAVIAKGNIIEGIEAKE